MNELANNKAGLRDLKEHDNNLAEFRLRMATTNDCILDQNEMLAQTLLVVRSSARQAQISPRRQKRKNFGTDNREPRARTTQGAQQGVRVRTERTNGAHRRAGQGRLIREVTFYPRKFPTPVTS